MPDSRSFRAYANEGVLLRRLRYDDQEYRERWEALVMFVSGLEGPDDDAASLSTLRRACPVHIDDDNDVPDDEAVEVSDPLPAIS